ncbi:hypothetical protein [Nannocystis pusilla]|uniref:hypothetical protein n=1 Tax=Nannocystis pusilla TaxID=889268 RepID=UPI003B7C53FA
MNGLPEDAIPGGLFWCYYGPAGPPGPEIRRLVARHRGVLVPIEGFDELMLRLSARLRIPLLDQVIESKARARVDNYRRRVEELQARLFPPAIAAAEEEEAMPAELDRAEQPVSSARPPTSSPLAPSESESHAPAPLPAGPAAQPPPPPRRGLESASPASPPPPRPDKQSAPIPSSNAPATRREGQPSPVPSTRSTTARADARPAPSRSSTSREDAQSDPWRSFTSEKPGLPCRAAPSPARTSRPPFRAAPERKPDLSLRAAPVRKSFRARPPPVRTPGLYPERLPRGRPACPFRQLWRGRPARLSQRL